MAKPPAPDADQLELLGISEDGIPILRTRVRLATKAMRRILPEFDEDLILAVAYEVGLDQCISYAEDAVSFNYDFTDLQLVAFTAAVAAVKELRDNVDL